MSTDPDTLLIDATDLRALPWLGILGDLGLRGPANRRGDDTTIPFLDGDLETPNLPIASYTWDITVRINGATRGERNAHLDALGEVLDGAAGDGLVTFTRKLANSADTGQVEFTTRGRCYSTDMFKLYNPWSGVTVLHLKNIRGRWKRTSDGVWVNR